MAPPTPSRFLQNNRESHVKPKTRFVEVEKKDEKTETSEVNANLAKELENQIRELQKLTKEAKELAKAV